MATRHLFGILLSSLAVSAHADFVILDPAPTKPVEKAAMPVIPGINPNASQGMPAPMMKAPSFGDAVRPVPSTPFNSLKDSLRKVTPQGWNVFLDKKINPETPVEFTPSVEWKESLRVMANRYNLVFKVDEEQKKLFIDQGPGGMRDLSKDNKGLLPATLEAEKPLPVTTPDGQLLLIIKSNQLLSDAIRTFLQAGKWDLEWNAGTDIELGSKTYTITGPNIKAVMDQVLPKFNLYSIIHEGNNTVEVLSKSDAK